MLKRYVIATLVSAFALSGAVAQTAAPATMSPDPSAPATSAPPGAVAGVPDMKAVHAACREQINGQTLKGNAKHQAVVACIEKARPDKAAAIQCRQDPSLKGMDPAAKHAAVKACIQRTKG